jgi:hypothetical protein
VAKLDERKRLALETARCLGRPIWAGDVASNAVDQELYRQAFRALVEEGELVRRPGPKGGRAFY